MFFLMISFRLIKSYMGFFLSLSAPSKENVWSKLKIVPVKIVKIFFFFKYI